MRFSLAGRAFRAAVLATLITVLAAAPSLAHESREVGEYTFVVGFIAEPVFTGQKSGLEFSVNRGEEPVEGLAETLNAEVIYQEQRRELPLRGRFGEPGWYQSEFFPTAAGPYTFHIWGTIEGTEVDEEFTSSEEGFDEVREATEGQFPVRYPAHADLVAQVEQASGASGQVLIALALGAAGTILGLIALGIAIASRRRTA
jgi:hypothetical protein